MSTHGHIYVYSHSCHRVSLCSHCQSSNDNTNTEQLLVIKTTFNIYLIVQRQQIPSIQQNQLTCTVPLTCIHTNIQIIQIIYVHVTNLLCVHVQTNTQIQVQSCTMKHVPKLKNACMHTRTHTHCRHCSTDRRTVFKSCWVGAHENMTTKHTMTLK